MTNITHPALLQAENEKLRGLLSEVAHCLRTSDEQPLYWEEEFASRIYRALSQQAEPTDTFTAVDMATAAAQGFRDGQAAVEPAPAQDEREAVEVVAVVKHDSPLLGYTDFMKYESWMADGLSPGWTQLTTVAQHERIVASLTRPAQTEQQPVSWQFYQDGKWWNGDDRIKDHRKNTEAAGIPVRDLYAAPIAQTAPRCEQPDAFEVARHSKRLVEQLRAENTRLKAECEQLSETVMGQERVIEDLEPDARRYRTLRQMHWSDGPLAVVANPKARVKLGADCPRGERLDQMLDALSL